jgi:hypothetical protein
MTYNEEQLRRREENDGDDGEREINTGEDRDM